MSVTNTVNVCGIEIPKVGYGTMLFPEPERAVELILHALKTGYRHIDTARKYGSEKWVGEGVRASGLAREDIVLDADIPHVIIRPNPWRRLKTKGSERTLPLVGCSLWAAREAVEASQHFPLPLPSLLQ